MLRLLAPLLIITLFSSAIIETEPPSQPNIILILADDMGYGDPGVYNPESKVPTPHIDALAARGIRYTDAHTNSAVCTPTRYGILTGQYSWRGPLKQGVTWSYDDLIVDTSMHTTADVLDDAGYYTACVGKWHLGLGWTPAGDSVRFDVPISQGPNDVGFDYFYGITASLDIPPYVYLRNNAVVQQPTGQSEGTAEGYYDDFWRRGPISSDFDHFQALDHLTDEAETVIRQGAERPDPFFLYFPLTAPHLPWIPREEFAGSSQAGNYGDLTAEVDATVGRITALLDSLGITEETMIIFTSDNGSQFSSERMTRYGHAANGPWRGRKGDIYEGGHRVPFIVSWPGELPQGEVDDRLVSTTDFYATFASLMGQTSPEDEIKDSQSFLTAPERDCMIYQSAKGLRAVRCQDDVLVDGRGSGGFMEVPDTSIADPEKQLYNLGEDGAQSRNFYLGRPERATELAEQFRTIVDPT